MRHRDPATSRAATPARREGKSAKFIALALVALVILLLFIAQRIRVASREAKLAGMWHFEFKDSIARARRIADNLGSEAARRELRETIDELERDSTGRLPPFDLTLERGGVARYETRGRTPTSVTGGWTSSFSGRRIDLSLPEKESRGLLTHFSVLGNRVAFYNSKQGIPMTLRRSGEPDEAPPPPPASPIKLSGEVRDERGRPVDGGLVWYEMPGRGQVSSVTDESGGYVLGVPSLPFPIEVFAARNAYLPASSFQWTTEGTKQSFIVERGLDVRLRVASKGRLVQTPTILPSATPDRLSGPQIKVHRWGESEFLVEGVLAEVPYDVWAPPSLSGELVLERRVKFGSDGLDLDWTPAREHLTGKLIAPPGAADVMMYVTLRAGLAVIPYPVPGAGAFRLGPVPAGTWRVDAQAKDASGRKWKWSGDLTTGVPGVVELRP